MESPSLKVQCQAALALRNLASDGALLSFVPESPLSQSRRTIPARDRQVARTPALAASLAVDLSALDTLQCGMCAERVHPPGERGADHRGRILESSDCSIII